MSFALICALIGLLVGPFLALLAEAVPDYGGGGQTPSKCRTCQADLPVRAYLPLPTQASQCPNCGEQISAGRLVTAVATVVTFFAVGSVVGSTWHVIPLLFLSCAAICLSAVDLARYRLPDRLLFPAIAMAVALLGAFALATDSTDNLIRGLITMLLYGLALLIPNLIMPTGLAFGDVKLALLLGLFLGWTAETNIGAMRLVVWAFFAGMLLGVFTGLIVGVGRRLFGHGFIPDPDFPPPDDGSFEPLLRTTAPFGPALALGALTVILLSERILEGASIFT